MMPRRRAESILCCRGTLTAGRVSMGYIGTLTGENDGIYGMQHREDTDFIITSGISGWEIPFKTGAVSEYVVIDVEKVS